MNPGEYDWGARARLDEHKLMIQGLQSEIAALKEVIGTTLVWIGQSANSPLSAIEVEQLLKMMGKTK